MVEWADLRLTSYWDGRPYLTTATGSSLNYLAISQE